MTTPFHDTPSGSPARGIRAWWLRHRAWLLTAAVLLALLPARDLWAPDEPDFAQMVREMKERGAWLLPYLNGQPYSEKPILFFWLMRISSALGEALTGGHGFIHGLAAWALRLPSVAVALGFAAAFRAWMRRFQPGASEELSLLVLVTTPIWVWQAQTIQIDMVFAALLAWSWLSWLGGYLLARELAPVRGARESARWFTGAYLALGFAVLAKGPLAVVLSLLLVAAFLAWQRDLRRLGPLRLGTGVALVGLVVLPWYAAAGLLGGREYFYQMVIHQNFERATQAWDHIQPWWRYGQYLAADFWPWSLLLPLAGSALLRARRQLDAATRFQILAFLVPLIFLSLSQSKQGKYLLPVYPFLALVLARTLPRPEHGARGWLAWALPIGLGVPALALLLVGFGHVGGHRLQAQVAPFLGPVRTAALIATAGTALAAWPRIRRRPEWAVRTAAATLATLYLVVGAWGFRLLDDTKSYRRWTQAVTPLIEGRKVYFWQTIRSGAMVYTGHRMPEVWTADDLDRLLGPEDRLVSQRREWDQDAWGMTPARRRRFEVVLAVPTGGAEFLLIRKRPEPGAP